MLAHESIANYFKINFALIQYHKYSLAELENMIPWEREAYLILLTRHIEKEKEKIETATKNKRIK